MFACLCVSGTILKLNGIDRVWVWILDRDGNAEPTESHIADIVSSSSIRVGQLERWLTMWKQHLRCGVRCSSAFFQFLHKHFPQNDVNFIPEYRTKNNRDSIGFGFDVSEMDPRWTFDNWKFPSMIPQLNELTTKHLQSLIFSVINNRSLIAGFAFLLKIKIPLKNRCKAISFQ